MSFRTKLAAWGWWILNGIRVLNFIALGLIMVASMVMVVETIMVSSFYVFDWVTHIITTFVAILLAITETPLFSKYIARNWPLFSEEHGFVTFAVFMFTLAVTILGNLNKEATSSKEIGPHFYGLIMAAGILPFIMAFVNVIANYLLRQRGATARQVRSKGVEALGDVENPPPASVSTLPVFPQQPMGAHKYAASSYYSQSRAASVRSDRSGYTEQTSFPPAGRTGPYNISRPMRADSLSSHPPASHPEIPLPQSAIHPALRSDNSF